MGHQFAGHRPRQRNYFAERAAFPRQPRASLQRVHLLHGFQSQQRRIQGDGTRALRRAEIRITNSAFDKLFGARPRKPESLVTQREMDLARSIQVITEEVMMKMVQHAHEETGLKKLCMAGGVALNCVANGRILREGPFEDIWIQPAAGDAGGAVGIALAIWHRYLGKERVSPEKAGTWQSQ